MVSNADVARTLERIADLLEIRGDNAFKVRAYRQAAVQVGNLGRSMHEVAADDGGLGSVDGFGAAIAGKVQELLDTGRCSYLEALEAEVPPTLIEILALPGVGPRTVALLWRDAGISTIDELEVAARNDGLAALPRLGSRTLENLCSALEARERRGGQAPARRERARVTPLAASLCVALDSHPAALGVEPAGSLRRGRATCGDLDILVATDTPVDLLVFFSALPQVERVLARGATKSSVHVDGGFQVDCRAVPPASFGAALQYFTGSQAHNVRLRGRALRLGLTLNEYGVFRVDDGTRIAGETEQDVYAALGLPWMPPKRREDPNEVDLVAHTTTVVAEA